MEPTVVTKDSAENLLNRPESQFFDMKSREATGKTLQKIAVALANSDGGEFVVGAEDRKTGHAPFDGVRRWQGFSVIEDANHVFQSLAQHCDPPVTFTHEWLKCPEANESLVLMVRVTKSPDVHETGDGSVYVRRSAASVKIGGQDRVALALSKGSRTFENQEIATYLAEELQQETELLIFLDGLNPHAEPKQFIARERLANRETAAVKMGAAVLFAANPSAVSPRRCAVKVVRYATNLHSQERKYLAAPPATIEGPARSLIDDTLAEVRRIIEEVAVIGPDGQPTTTRYPPEALKEIVVNAVIHRDYNISDDIKIFVYDNRVEVHSPGRLPGHMTVDTVLSERFSRNPTINRLINKYPDPPNQDIGEGLKTVMRSMQDAKLKPPKFYEQGNTFVVSLGHEPLARPEALVLEYLQSNAEITNSAGRDITGINSENSMKEVFYALRNAGQLERVPGKGGNKASWQLTQPEASKPTLDLVLNDAAPPPKSSMKGQGLSTRGGQGQRHQPKRLTRSQRQRMKP